MILRHQVLESPPPRSHSMSLEGCKLSLHYITQSLGGMYSDRMRRRHYYTKGKGVHVSHVIDAVQIILGSKAVLFLAYFLSKGANPVPQLSEDAFSLLTAAPAMASH